MLQCKNVMWFEPFLHNIYAYMVAFTVYLFNPNAKYRDMYRILQVSQKNTEIGIFAHFAQPYFEETCIW